MATQIFFISTPKIGEDEPILTHIFAIGLKPPTRVPSLKLTEQKFWK